ncbi:MAG: hypothetical protein NC548_58370 [Lachnospiraceae bacterium]|nr:hypothetical protein [Lachnospiraceae bacterium]
MKYFVARLINLVNNNMLFCLILAFAAVALGLLYMGCLGVTGAEAAGTATAFVMMVAGIRVLFSYCLPRIKEEYRDDPWGRIAMKTLIWGFIIFLTGPIVAIFKAFIFDASLYSTVNTFNLWIGYFGMGLVSICFLTGFLYGITNLWRHLVKWANF